MRNKLQKIKVDKEKLELANKIFANYGITNEEAFEAFLDFVITNDSLPFSVGSEDSNALQSASFIRTAVELLVAQCEYIFYVDVDTNHYREYVTKEGYQVAGVNRIGDDFFRDTYQSIDIIIYEKDRAKLKQQLSKKEVLKGCENGNIYNLNYRMILKGFPEYYNMRVSRSAEDSSFLIFEVRNVQKQYLQEEQYKKRIKKANDEARIDSLTHCYNYLAFAEIKDEINDKIKHNKIDFAFAMCDLNDLKNINDSLGHLIGDQYLIESAEMIRKFFPNSNIYRVGGDEFIVIIVGEDYKNRLEIVERFKAQSFENIYKNQAVVAIGLADVDFSIKNINDLYETADNEMYKHKKALKQSK